MVSRLVFRSLTRDSLTRVLKFPLVFPTEGSILLLQNAQLIGLADIAHHHKNQMVPDKKINTLRENLLQAKLIKWL